MRRAWVGGLLVVLVAAPSQADTPVDDDPPRTQRVVLSGGLRSSVDLGTGDASRGIVLSVVAGGPRRGLSGMRVGGYVDVGTDAVHGGLVAAFGRHDLVSVRIGAGGRDGAALVSQTIAVGPALVFDGSTAPYAASARLALTAQEGGGERRLLLGLEVDPLLVVAGLLGLFGAAVSQASGT